MTSPWYIVGFPTAAGGGQNVPGEKQVDLVFTWRKVGYFFMLKLKIMLDLYSIFAVYYIGYIYKKITFENVFRYDSISHQLHLWWSLGQWILDNVSFEIIYGLNSAFVFCLLPEDGQLTSLPEITCKIVNAN